MTRPTVANAAVTDDAMRGSSTNSSTASSMDRAAAIISWAADWRCSRPARAGSGAVPSSVVIPSPPGSPPGPHSPALRLGLRLIPGKDDPQFALSEGGIGDRPPSQRVGKQQGTPIRAHTNEQLVALATDFEVVVIGERQLQREVVAAGPASDLEHFAFMQDPGGIPVAVHHRRELAQPVRPDELLGRQRGPQH